MPCYLIKQGRCQMRDVSQVQIEGVGEHMQAAFVCASNQAHSRLLLGTTQGLSHYLSESDLRIFGQCQLIIVIRGVSMGHQIVWRGEGLQDRVLRIENGQAVTSCDHQNLIILIALAWLLLLLLRSGRNDEVTRFVSQS